MANISNFSQKTIANYSCRKQLHTDNLQREAKFITSIIHAEHKSVYRNRYAQNKPKMCSHWFNSSSGNNFNLSVFPISMQMAARPASTIHSTTHGHILLI